MQHHHSNDSDEKIQHHSPQSSSAGPIRCSACPASFAVWEPYFSHCAMSHPTASVKCLHCKEFVAGKILQEHVMTQHAPRMFSSSVRKTNSQPNMAINPCMLCGYKPCSMEDLINHVRRNHPNEETKIHLHAPLSTMCLGNPPHPPLSMAASPPQVVTTRVPVALPVGNPCLSSSHSGSSGGPSFPFEHTVTTQTPPMIKPMGFPTYPLIPTGNPPNGPPPLQSQLEAHLTEVRAFLTRRETDYLQIRVQAIESLVNQKTQEILVDLQPNHPKREVIEQLMHDLQQQRNRLTARAKEAIENHPVFASETDGKERDGKIAQTPVTMKPENCSLVRSAMTQAFSRKLLVFFFGNDNAQETLRPYMGRIVRFVGPKDGTYKDLADLKRMAVDWLEGVARAPTYAQQFFPDVIREIANHAEMIAKRVENGSAGSVESLDNIRHAVFYKCMSAVFSKNYHSERTSSRMIAVVSPENIFDDDYFCNLLSKHYKYNFPHKKTEVLAAIAQQSDQKFQGFLSSYLRGVMHQQTVHHAQRPTGLPPLIPDQPPPLSGGAPSGGVRTVPMMPYVQNSTNSQPNRTASHESAGSTSSDHRNTRPHSHPHLVRNAAIRPPSQGFAPPPHLNMLLPPTRPQLGGGFVRLPLTNPHPNLMPPHASMPISKSKSNDSALALPPTTISAIPPSRDSLGMLLTATRFPSESEQKLKNQVNQLQMTIQSRDREICELKSKVERFQCAVGQPMNDKHTPQTYVCVCIHCKSYNICAIELNWIICWHCHRKFRLEKSKIYTCEQAREKKNRKKNSSSFSSSSSSSSSKNIPQSPSSTATTTDGINAEKLLEKYLPQSQGGLDDVLSQSELTQLDAVVDSLRGKDEADILGFLKAMVHQAIKNRRAAMDLDNKLAELQTQQKVYYDTLIQQGADIKRLETERNAFRDALMGRPKRPVEIPNPNLMIGKKRSFENHEEGLPMPKKRKLSTSEKQVRDHLLDAPPLPSLPPLFSGGDDVEQSPPVERVKPPSMTLIGPMQDYIEDMARFNQKGLGICRDILEKIRHDVRKNVLLFKHEPNFTTLFRRMPEYTDVFDFCDDLISMFDIAINLEEKGNGPFGDGDILSWKESVLLDMSCRVFGRPREWGTHLLASWFSHFSPSNMADVVARVLHGRWEGKHVFHVWKNAEECCQKLGLNEKDGKLFWNAVQHVKSCEQKQKPPVLMCRFQ